MAPHWPRIGPASATNLAVARAFRGIGKQWLVEGLQRLVALGLRRAISTAFDRIMHISLRDPT
jgi:hypothetical protein